jgi:chromosome segregation protein
VASELAEVRRYLFGRDLSAVEAKLRAASQEKWQLQASEASVRRALSSLDAEVLSAEAALESAVESRTGPVPADLLSRAESARAKTEGLGAVLAERRRSLEREMAASPDAGLVASLEEEAAALRTRLHETDEEAASLLPRVDSLAEAEEALAAAEAGVEARWGRRPVAGAGDRAAETRGELAALRATSERSALEAARLGDRLGSLAERQGRLVAEREGLTTKLDAARRSAEALAGEAERCRGAELSGERTLREAEDLLRFADAERNRWSARAEALESALEQARAKAGAQRLGELPGVLGALLDLVEVDEGYGSAFEAAAGEVLSGVLVDSSATARRALAVLHAGGAPGAVLPLDMARLAGRPDEMPVSVSVTSGDALVEKLRSRVRGRTPGVEALLDSMLARAVVVQGTWEQAFDFAVADPTLVVVTRQGDRFARGLWGTGSGATGVTAAAVEEARRNSVAARERSERAAEALHSARTFAEESRASRVGADRSVESNEANLRSVVESLERSAAELADVEAETASLAKQRADATFRRQREQSRIAELDSVLPGLERHASLEAERAASERSERADLAQQATEVAAMRRDLEVRAAGLDERRALTEHRLEEVDERLRRQRAERERAAGRRAAAERALVVAASLSDLVAERRGALDGVVAALRHVRDAETAAEKRRGSELESLRRRRSTTERELGEMRERASRIEVGETEARLRLEALVEAVRRDLDCEPEAVRGSAMPELPAGTSASNRRVELERELRLMGPINPLALEEHEALLERSRFLEAQLEDVRNARRELTKVIRAVDTEIIEIFGAAYADVAENFEKLFATLFPGGEGRLKLTDPDNLLDTGIEIDARPSGKNLRRLSLLSGGERSLAALAFLFAVFRARPSPFYMLDEVEAALDDVNLHRFLDLVHEFRDEAQLLIVSHQKRTMEAADCLYGVTMAPGGSSKVVSERIGDSGEPVGASVQSNGEVRAPARAGGS